MVLVVPDCSFSRVGPMVVWWDQLVVEVYLLVQVVGEEMGDFIVTSQVTSPEVIIQEYLVGFLESS